MMTQAEQETIEVFCRELALALRRITGKNIEIRPDMLPKLLEDPADPTVENDPESKPGQDTP
jgi:hypothetical protein